jgi:ribosomal protein S18 acetylase RimI-like enzyme
MNTMIEYRMLQNEEIELIRPLWEKLREHHQSNSNHFKDRYLKFTFEKRRDDLREKAERGKLRIDIAEDNLLEKIVGYCVSSINSGTKEKEGEIDSIFIDANYRKLGIGDQLMKLSLNWLNEEKVVVKKIIVAEGNEGVYTFYQKYGFYHLSNVLQQRDDI